MLARAVLRATGVFALSANGWECRCHILPALLRRGGQTRAKPRVQHAPARAVRVADLLNKTGDTFFSLGNAKAFSAPGGVDAGCK
eukprot:scaffold4868_cov416-Prasinococcus_capsulatus_cf.AAC.20